MSRVQPRLHPWHAAILTIVTSVVGGACVTAAGLAARGRRSTSRRVLLYSLPLGGLVLFVLSALPIGWDKIAWLLLLCNLACGMVFAWLLRRWPLPDERPAAGPEGTGWSILWGTLGGALIASYIGGGAGVLYLLATDRVISTVFPSIAGRFTALIEFITRLVDFILIGGITGGILGSKRPNIQLQHIAWALIGCVLTYYTAQLAWTLLVGIPMFQGYKLAASSWVSFRVLQGLFWIFSLTISVFGALLCAERSGGGGSRWRTAGLLSGTVLASVLSLVVYSGRLSYDFLLLGQLLEKQSHLAPAKGLYELGLAQRPDGAISSYLQFRIGLLYRKLGRNQEARTALSKVVTKYTQRPALVALAQRFLTASEDAPRGASRRTIPGIETRTEFKSAYCVPNSLSLVLQYWKTPIPPKAIGQRITSIDFGTTVTDALWYVQTKGLQHWVVPLASMDDVKHLLDQQIPLLLYIPRHVLAVFGYDEAFNSLVAYDVAEEDIWVDHPIEEFIPKWKHELSTMGVVLPPERFAGLPAETQRQWNRFTRAYVHHELHLAYHASDDSVDQDRALAHLEAAVALAPEFFFDLAHLYVRTGWGARLRETLASTYDLKAAAQRGLSFSRYQFGDNEVLPELALLLLDLREEETLHQFLEQRFKEGTLGGHADLVGLLGVLEYQHGNMDAAIAYLTTLKDAERYPMVLGAALETAKSWQAAMNEYQRVLELERPDEDETGWEVHLASRALEAVPSPVRSDDMAASLFMRRSAMARIAALTDQLHDQERLRTASRAYLTHFPWDAEVQARYADALGEAWSRSAGLPADTREALRRELTRTLGLLESLDLDGRWRDRVDHLRALTKTG